MVSHKAYQTAPLRLLKPRQRPREAIPLAPLLPMTLRKADARLIVTETEILFTTIGSVMFESPPAVGKRYVSRVFV